MVDELRALEDAALSFANVLRARDAAPLAKSLQPGRVQDTAGCPVAVTAGAARSHPTWGLTDGWQVGKVAARFGPRGGVMEVVPVPGAVHEFMAAFDTGTFPHLDAVREVVGA